MMKRKLVFILLFISALYSKADSYDFEVDGIYYLRQGSIAAVVKKENSLISGYTGEVTIPATVTYNDVNYEVTCIYNNAFYKSSITKIHLPNTIREILGTAFTGCSQLTEITLPPSLVTIGTGAFAQTGITHITIPASVENIRYQNNVWYGGAFEGCESLETVIFEEKGCKLTYLPSKIFAGCVNLTSIVFPSSLINIGADVIGIGDNKKGCDKMTSISLPDNLQVIGGSAFAYSCLKNIVIPGSVKRIEGGAFGSCKELESVTLSEGVGSLEEGGDPFRGCDNLVNVYLPSTMENVPSYFFQELPKIESIIIPSNVKSIGQNAFSRCKVLETVSLPDKLESIGDYAFDNCTNLSLSLPASVNSVGESAFSRIKSLNIVNYDNWMNIVVKNRVFGSGWSKVYHNGALMTDYVLPSGIKDVPDYTFILNKDIKSVILPSTITRIGKAAFRECNNLVSINMPDNLTEIDEQAFYQCNKLIGITFPDKLETISNSAFNQCSSLTEIIFGKKIKVIGQNVFYGCSSISKVDIGDIANWCNVEFDGKPSKGLQEGNPLALSKKVYLNGVELTELTIPLSVIKIKDYVFNNCINIKKLVIPSSVVSIGNYSFSCCSGLTRIEVPSAVKTLGEGAFYGCSGITTFTLPDYLSEISPYLFYQCSNLQSVKTQAGINGIGDFAFSGCTSLNDVNIPDGVEIIKKYAFENCQSLSSINIPSTVKTIGVGAFNGCSGLNALYITDMAAWSSIKYIYQYNQGAGTGTAMEPQFMSSNPLRCAHHLYLNNQKVTKLVIPSNVEDITPIAFWGLTDVESVTIPSNVKSIGYDAFAESSIKTIYCYAEKAPELYKYKVYLQYNTLEKDESYIPEQFEGTVSLTGRKQNLTSIYVPQNGLSSYKSLWSSHADVVYPMTEPIAEPLNFTEEEVKRVSLEKWDTDGDGELSMDEAKAVTDLNNVFRDNKTITSFNELQFFTGLKVLNYLDFDGCTNLETITLPASLEEIGDAPFGNCNALKSIVIPASVKKIGNTNIGTYLWNLESIQVEEGNTVYDSRGNCNAIIETASNKLITGCQSTVIPNDVTTIAAWAFNSCAEKPIVIPEGVTTIEKSAFLGNHFKTIVLPSTLSSMTQAFNGCSLKMVESHIMDPFALDELTFDMADNAVLYVPKGTKEKYGAMKGWKKFAAIIELEDETEDNVINFEDEAVKQLCLDNWDVNASGELSFNEAAGILDLERVFYTSNISKFQELQYFTRLKSIGEYAFRECGLASVVLPQSVESIDHGAFISSKMTEIDIPASVTSIGENAFLRCNSLASVKVNWQEPIAIDEKAFPTRANIVLNVPLGTKSAYQDAPYWKEFKEISSTHVGPSGTYSIEDENAATLTDGSDMVQKETVIPSSITIDGQEFEVTAIGENAFANNTEMTQLTIPESISEIGQGAFAGCSALEVIYNYRKDPIPLGHAVAAARTRGAESSEVFAGVNKETCVLYVPAGSKSKYAAADGWKEFQTIKEFGVVATKPGDANNDDKINVADIVEIVNFKKGTPSENFNEANADVNADGDVNDEDIKAIEDYLLNVEPKTLKELKAQANLGGEFSKHLGWYVDGAGNISSSDADAVGRICFISTSDVDIAFVGSRILVLANEDLTDEHGITWGVYGDPMHLTATKEPEGLCGYNNTNTLQAHGHGRAEKDASGTRVEYESGYPAACYAWNYSGAKPVGASHWFLPSYAQWKNMISTARQSGAGQLTSGLTYWSSTDNSGNRAYIFSLVMSGDNPKSYTLTLNPDYEESWIETWEKWSKFGVRACYAY